MNMELPKNKWFWIFVPLLAMFCIAMVLTFIQNVDATPVSSCGSQQACVEQETANIAGVVTAGNFITKANFRDASHIGDITGLSVITGMPGASGTPTATYTISNLVGCTSGTATTQQTLQMTYNSFSYDQPFTLTDTTCTGTIRVQISAGVVSQEVWDVLIRFTMRASNDIESLNKDCEHSTWNSACAITDFETITGLNVFEFFTLIILLVIAVIVWSRSNDFMVQLSMVTLTFVPGVIWLLLWVAQHAVLSLPLGILTFILGGYMGVRAGIDQFSERSEKRES